MINILSESIIFIFFISNFVMKPIERIDINIISILIYICIKFICYINNNKKEIKYVYMVVCFYLIFLYFNVNLYFIFFLPNNLFVLFDDFKLDIYLSVLVIVFSSFLLKRDIRVSYIVIALLNFIIYKLNFAYNNRNNYLMSVNKEMKDKNYKLIKKINKEEEYLKQLQYTLSLEERNKLAQKLHDRLGHTISGSIMQLEACNILLDKDINKSKELLVNSIENLRQGMNDIRKELKNLKPESEQIGINNINLMLAEFERKTSIKSILIFNGDIEKINYLHWRIINENIKEGLTNIIKYSRATKVNAEIRVYNKIIKVEIKDNGIGCYNVKKGLGIIGMEERVGEIGGKIIVDGSNGFSIITIIPIMK